MGGMANDVMWVGGSRCCGLKEWVEEDGCLLGRLIWWIVVVGGMADEAGVC